MKNLEVYDALVAKCEGIERKGKTMPYTSDNGYMFSLLNKDGEIGIRLPEEEQESFKDKYNATEFRSYGAVMRDYVRIPENLHSELDLLATYLKKGEAFVNSLPPNTTKKKK